MTPSSVPRPQNTGGLRRASSASPGCSDGTTNPERQTAAVNRSGAVRSSSSAIAPPCEKPSSDTEVYCWSSSQASTASTASATGCGSGTPARAPPTTRTPAPSAAAPAAMRPPARVAAAATGRRGRPRASRSRATARSAAAHPGSRSGADQSTASVSIGIHPYSHRSPGPPARPAASIGEWHPSALLTRIRAGCPTRNSPRSVAACLSSMSRPFRCGWMGWAASPRSACCCARTTARSPGLSSRAG